MLIILIKLTYWHVIGGMIAQIAAVKHPERILTLTLLATSVMGSDENTRDLPPMDERILTHHVNGTSIDWANKNDVYLVSISSIMHQNEYLMKIEFINK